MGELVTLAAQAGIFFLFTPLCLIARYGGRAIDLRKAAAERRATMRMYGVDGVAWEPAGEAALDDFGNLHLPRLPAAPGLRRLEFTGPYPGMREVTITGAANLQALSAERRPGWQFADDDMRAHLKVGGVIHVSYIDTITSRDGAFDLADRMHRQQAVDFMRQEAQIEAARAA
jgi:hypothetical protein